jgi:hypothetical protein
MGWSVETFRFSPAQGLADCVDSSTQAEREKLAVLVCTDLSRVFAASFPACLLDRNAVGTGDLRPLTPNLPAPILEHFSIAACPTLRQKEFTQNEFS